MSRLDAGASPWSPARERAVEHSGRLDILANDRPAPGVTSS
jgi:hypothetical protein